MDARASRQATGPTEESRGAAFVRAEKNKYFLHAGLVFVAETPTVVTTILGSCVSVCLWDQARGIGGLNHFLLPMWAGQGRQTTRFGNVAVATLVEHLTSLGCRSQDLVAKLFGGASILGSAGTSMSALGSRNIETARNILAEEALPIVSEDVGGTRGRKLLFHTDDGSAWIKKL